MNFHFDARKAFVFSLVALAFSSVPGQAATLFGDPQDRELNQDGSLQAAATGATLRAGSSGSLGGGRNGLVVFQLPDFGSALNPFLSADLGLYLALNTGTFTFNADVYGLGVQDTATLTVGSGVLATSRFYEGNAVDSTATLIQLDFTTGGSTAAVGYRNTDATGDLNLLNFLNTAYAGGSNANKFVVLRISPDADTGTGTFGYNFSAADVGNTGATTAGTGTNFDPVITYSAVPEPSAFALLASTGVLGLLRRRRS